MRRVLLTSSEASFIVTGIVVLSCTLALFLSGYVIQQRTVRDLRDAIRPRPRASLARKPHLPGRFQARITELADGSIVFYESEAEEEARAQRQYTHSLEEKMIIQVRDSSSSSLSTIKQQQQQQQQEEEESRDKTTPTPRQRQMLRDLQRGAARMAWAVDNPDPWAKSRVPVDAVERRRMIREELRRLSMSDEPVPWMRRIWY